MEDIDILILNHLARYTVSLRKVIEVLFFNGGRAETALKRLEKQGYIRCNVRELPGNYSYYQLTKKGAGILPGVSENKGNPKKDLKTLSQNLGALWFCCMGEQTRKRLTDSELKGLCGAPRGGNVIHAAQMDDATIFRLFIPDPSVSLQRYVLSLKSAAHGVCLKENLIPWIERGTYRFAILVGNEERKATLTELIGDEDFPDLRVEIALAPTLGELPLFVTPKEDAS